MTPLDGFVYDLSLAVSDRRPGSREESVAVIALDRDSLDSDELAAMPRVFLSPVWAKLVNALTEAKARAIGFDIIFSYSANRFPGFAGQYDQDFLAALSRDGTARFDPLQNLELRWGPLLPSLNCHLPLRRTTQDRVDLAIADLHAAV